MTKGASVARLCGIVCALMCLVGTRPSHAQFSDSGATRVRVQTNQFTLTGTTEDGEPWKLTGSRSRATGPMMFIDDFEMEFVLPSSASSSRSSADSVIRPDAQGDTRIIIRSPHCEYNLLTQEIKSDAPIAITIGSNLNTTGIGYDLDVRKRVILIRSAVAISLNAKKK